MVWERDNQSVAPPVFDRMLYAVCDQKLEAGMAWERCNMKYIILQPVRYETYQTQTNVIGCFLFTMVQDIHASFGQPTSSILACTKH